MFQHFLGSTSKRRARQALRESLVLATVLDLGEKVDDGVIVRAVTLPWFQIIEELERDPDFIRKLDWRKWEEMLAGLYERDGYEVILTPRSNDKGRDLIATKRGIVTVRIVDQMKHYSPGHVVKLEEVNSMLGVITTEAASKAVITTTSDFAPGVYSHEGLARLMPHRLELRPREKLIDALVQVAHENPPNPD